jgi:hypothetical protein
VFISVKKKEEEEEETVMWRDNHPKAKQQHTKRYGPVKPVQYVFQKKKKKKKKPVDFNRFIQQV